MPLVRHALHDAVKTVHGALVTDSRGIFDASRSESPQKSLRSSKSGVELEQTVDDMLRGGAVLRWNHGGAMLADALTKRSPLARRTFELFLQNAQRWRLIFDRKFQSERRRAKAGMARLVENDVPEPAESGEPTAEGMSIFYEHGDGESFEVKLILEGDWVRLPRSEQMDRFMANCHRRIAEERSEAQELESGDELLGGGFAREARTLSDAKHFIGTWDLQEVPLQTIPDPDPFQKLAG